MNVADASIAVLRLTYAAVGLRVTGMVGVGPIVYHVRGVG
jgi:hypothetical protein